MRGGGAYERGNKKMPQVLAHQAALRKRIKTNHPYCKGKWRKNQWLKEQSSAVSEKLRLMLS